MISECLLLPVAGRLVTFYCITIPQDNKEAGESLSYKMIWCESYSLIDQEQIIELAKTLNRIHFYGQTGSPAGNHERHPSRQGGKIYRGH